MRIRKLDIGRRRDVQALVMFPFALYRRSSQWVPPLVAAAAESLLDPRKHPFYRHSTADFILAESEGQPLGRIALIENRRHNTYRHSQAATFGYFEAVDDVAVARALFDAAFAWACERGLNEVIGPRGLIGAEAGGVLVEGFEHRAAMDIPYNPPYYDALIRDSGVWQRNGSPLGLPDERPGSARALLRHRGEGESTARLAFW